MARKLAVVLLAVAMILSYVGTAAAAQFSDVAGYKHEAAIGRLASLGLLAGYPDGTFKPDQTITRAEFAKVIVIALGLKEAAEVMTGVPTAFSDVAATHWATGYINVAASQGIVNGYPDGTFKPDAQVTYAEALAMILRALGYEPTLKGVWPTKYLVKAAELGITKGVTFSANVPATRGDVAALVDNALTVKKVVQTGWGDQVSYVVGEKTLLEENLGCTKVEGWLIDSPELFTNEGDTIKVDTGAAQDPVKTLDVLAGASWKGLLGHKVRAWQNADGDVFFIEDLTPAASVKSAVYKGTATVEIDGKDVVLGTGVKMFRNYAGPAAVALQSGDEITVIYDGDTPKYVVALKYETGIVDSVSTAYEKIYFSAYTSAASLGLKDYEVTFVGAAGKLADLQKSDVVQYIADATNKKAVLIVTRNAKTGKFTKLTSAGVATVGGVDYKFAAPGVADANLLGKDVKILLNKDGKIVSMSAVEEEAAEVIAALLGKATGNFGEKMVKVLTKDGKTAVLTLASDVEFETGLSWDALSEGDVIAYTLGADGKIDTVARKVYYAGGATRNIDVDADYHLISSYVMTEDTAYFDYTDGLDEIAVCTRADIEANDTIDGFVVADEGKAVVVVMTRGELAVGEEQLGMVIDEYRNADKKYVLSVLAKGTVTDYVYGTNSPGIESLSVVKFSVKGANEFATLSALTATALPAGADEYRVTKVDAANKLITVQAYKADGTKVGSPAYYVVTADTLYFDITDTDNPKSIGLGDVAVNAVVDLYVEGAKVKALVVKE